MEYSPSSYMLSKPKEFVLMDLSWQDLFLQFWHKKGSITFLDFNQLPLINLVSATFMSEWYRWRGLFIMCWFWMMYGKTPRSKLFIFDYQCLRLKVILDTWYTILVVAGKKMGSGVYWNRQQTYLDISPLPTILYGTEIEKKIFM